MAENKVDDLRSKPFVMVTKSVIDDTVHIRKGSTKLVYAIICSHADNRTNDAFPSVQTIAEKACCSEHTVRRAIKELRELGLLIVENRYSEDGRQTSNRYILVDPPADFVGRVSRE